MRSNSGQTVVKYSFTGARWLGEHAAGRSAALRRWPAATTDTAPPSGVRGAVPDCGLAAVDTRTHRIPTEHLASTRRGGASWSNGGQTVVKQWSNTGGEYSPRRRFVRPHSVPARLERRSTNSLKNCILYSQKLYYLLSITIFARLSPINAANSSQTVVKQWSNTGVDSVLARLESRSHQRRADLFTQ